MIFKNLCVALIGTCGLTFSAAAQEVIELESKNRPERAERVPILNSGPITTIGAAALLIARFDRNGNYAVDASEFKKGQAAAFKAADADRNGRLSLSELENWRLKALGATDASPGRIFFDTDYSQAVSRAEFADAFDRIFSLSDADENGEIIFSELVKVVTPQKPRERSRESREPIFSDAQRGGRRP